MNFEARINKIKSELLKREDLNPDTSFIDKMTDEEVDIYLDNMMDKFYKEFNIKSYEDLKEVMDRKNFVTGERLFSEESKEFRLDYWREHEYV